MQKLMDHAEEINAEFIELGYKYITLDLAGLRSGNLNSALKL